MASISQIQVNGTTYDIYDANAVNRAVSQIAETKGTLITDTNNILITRWGPMIMIQCHGLTWNTTDIQNPVIENVLSDYKPKYNISTILTAANASSYLARLWVNASNGDIYMAAASTPVNTVWYGTLTYIYNFDL